MFNKWLAHCSPQRKKSLIQWVDVNLGSPDRNSTLLKCHFLRLSDKARAGADRQGGLGINIFPRRSISLVRPNGCLPAPCGRESPSGQKQIKAHTLQIGGLPQLARRLEFSTALTEKSVSFLLPISLSPCFKRKSHPLHTSGPPPALPIFPLRWPGSGLCSGKGQAAWKGVKVEESALWRAFPPPHPSQSRCAQGTVSQDWFIRPIYLRKSVITLRVKN